MTTLQQIRERAERAVAYQYESQFAIDRRYLLNLVERMRPYVGHKEACRLVHNEENVRPYVCTCGLDALLEELKSE